MLENGPVFGIYMVPDYFTLILCISNKVEYSPQV